MIELGRRPPNCIELTPDNRWQVVFKGEPMAAPFDDEQVAMAYLTALMALEGLRE